VAGGFLLRLWRICRWPACLCRGVLLSSGAAIVAKQGWSTSDGRDYVDGKRSSFDVQQELSWLTPFRREVMLETQRVPRGQVACALGQCVLSSCSQGFADCNKQFVDGCEVNLLTDRWRRLRWEGRATGAGAIE